MADVDLSQVGRLIGEPARAAMLGALIDGRALAAGELARIAAVSPATASGHLARLRAGRLVDVVPAGRHRYYRLYSPEVAHVLEALALISPPLPVRSLRHSRSARAMAEARTCYDHLAGRLGVALHDRFVEAGAFRVGGDGYEVTSAGAAMFAAVGVDLDAVRRARRTLARPCLDFTERRPHLAGALGAAVCARMLQRSWVVRRAKGDRGLRLTDDGRTGLAEVLHLYL